MRSQAPCRACLLKGNRRHEAHRSAAPHHRPRDLGRVPWRWTARMSARPVDRTGRIAQRMGNSRVLARMSSSRWQPARNPFSMRCLVRMSGGQRQRVAIARALFNPDAIIADEHVRIVLYPRSDSEPAWHLKQLALPWSSSATIFRQCTSHRIIVKSTSGSRAGNCRRGVQPPCWTTTRACFAHFASPPQPREREAPASKSGATARVAFCLRETGNPILRWMWGASVLKQFCSLRKQPTGLLWPVRNCARNAPHIHRVTWSCKRSSLLRVMISALRRVSLR